MKIDGDTHWYIKKFLSHLVAYEPVAGKQTRYTVLYPYTNGANKSLSHIAREFSTEEEALRNYNKWLKTSAVPDDKPYTVIIPVQVDQSQDLLALAEDEKEEAEERSRDNEAFGHKQQKPGKLPRPSKDRLAIVELNDLEGVIAREGDNLASLAELGSISESRFRNYNDLSYSDKIQAGQFYYLEKKRRKARVYEHVLQANENLWQVSQQYGVRLKKLRQKNRLEKNETPKAGRVLWLRFIRPRHIAVEHREVKAARQPLYASTKAKGTLADNEMPEGSLPTESKKSTPVAEEKELPQVPVQPAKETVVKEDDTRLLSDTSKTNKSQQPAKAKEEKPGRHLMQPDSSLEREEPVQKLPQEGNPLFPETKNTTQAAADSSQRKIPQEKQEKVPKTKLVEQPEEEQAPSDSFAVEEPVNFIEAEPGQQADSTHRVKAGETLYSLSRQYNVTVQNLIQWNQLPSQPVLSIGQVLRLSLRQLTGSHQRTPGPFGYGKPGEKVSGRGG